MSKRNAKNKGFIAILSLLIISTISMVIAIKLLRDGIDNASLSIFSINYENARMNAITCVEDSLLRIKHENQFTDNLSYTIEEGETCSTTISWYTPQVIDDQLTETLVDLLATGVSGNFTRTFDYELKIKTHTVHNVDDTVQYMNNINVIAIEEINS